MIVVSERKKIPKEFHNITYYIKVKTAFAAVKPFFKETNTIQVSVSNISTENTFLEFRISKK